MPASCSGAALLSLLHFVVRSAATQVEKVEALRGHLLAAPEIISNQRHYDGKMVDVWSAGVMLYVMLFCRYPFERPEDQYDSRRFQKVRLQSFRLCKMTIAGHIQKSMRSMVNTDVA